MDCFIGQITTHMTTATNNFPVFLVNSADHLQSKNLNPLPDDKF